MLINPDPLYRSDPVIDRDLETYRVTQIKNEFFFVYFSLCVCIYALVIKPLFTTVLKTKLI